MGVALKKGVVLLVLVFVGFYMFTDPSGAATFAKEGANTGWDGLVKFFEAIISFLNALFS